MYSLALIIFVVSEKKAFEHFPIGSNVNLQMYVLRWQLSWISDQHKKQKLYRRPSNDHSNMIKAKLYMNNGPLQSLGILL
jgi:hypothetical protein